MRNGLKNRLIAVVLLKNGRIVQSRRFSRYQALGNPYDIVSRLSNWQCDELIYLDISRDGGYDLLRDDLNCENRSDAIGIIEAISKKCFVPLTVGGRIRSIQDIYQRLHSGADKVSVNTMLFTDQNIVKEAVKEFGSQCIVASIDVKNEGEGIWYVYANGGREKTDHTVENFSRDCEGLGVGELLINSIDRDGAGQGFDIPLLEQVSDSVSIPVIGLGGAGDWLHFEQAFKQTRVAAIAAANIFQHRENSVYQAKKYLYEQGCNVRQPLLKTMQSVGGF